MLPASGETPLNRETRLWRESDAKAQEHGPGKDKKKSQFGSGLDLQ